MAAFAMIGITLIYAAFGGPVVSGMHQVSQMEGGLIGGAVSQMYSVSVIPNIGAILFLIAPLALFQAQRRERTPA
jgi:predicted MFS family arabinose efflux permease